MCLCIQFIEVWKYKCGQFWEKQTSVIPVCLVYQIMSNCSKFYVLCNEQRTFC